MDLLSNKGVALEKQSLTWNEMADKPISKLDDEAFTRFDDALRGQPLAV
jgi:hypothetical protein